VSKRLLTLVEKVFD